jgi:hypothetical protein
MTKQQANRTPPARSFSWGIKASNISFMRSAAAETTLAGCDCGCGVVKLAETRSTRKQASRRAAR